MKTFGIDTKLQRIFCSFAMVLFSLVCIGTSTGASGPAAQVHATIREYKGPSTCVVCHQIEAEDMFGSVHYQWSGSTPNVTNISGDAGKADGGFSTYCGTPASSPQATCASCHVSYGKVPSDTMSTEQLNNIDCLMCHQDRYKRKPVPAPPVADFNLDRLVDSSDLSRLVSFWLGDGCGTGGCDGTDLDGSGAVGMPDYSIFSGHWLSSGEFNVMSFTDYLGVTREYRVPGQDDAGNFRYAPDEQNMPISALEAARTVHMPTRASCLKCHANAAGGDGGKRGDLSSVSNNPPAVSDIHMSSQGANLSCQYCHQFQNHRVLGRGLDLRPNDRPERLTCDMPNCHSSTPHADTMGNNHAARIACQTCHISTYAKDVSTELTRDWSNPQWSPTLLDDQGGYKPGETRGSNLVPTYKWFDGTSNVYVLGQTAVTNSQGEYELASPNGSVTSNGAKIYPMKEHLSNSGLHDASGQLIPHSAFKYFVTGDFSRAVADGMEHAGLTGSWSMVDLHTYQTINHGVEPKSSALDCGECHEFYSGGAAVRMNMTSKLGYAVKGPYSTVCSQCHENKNSKGFEGNHKKHVTDKKFDCSWCHNFSRPERGLIRP